jgi:predicted glycosyltransferase/predicted transcriptional regulator
MEASEKKIKKIWIAMSTPFQANFFAPLIKELEGEFDFLITARQHDSIFAILNAKKIKFIPVGHHGGRELFGKLEAYADTIKQMAPIIEREKPDLLLTERWPEAVRVATALNIPAWAIFYDERETHVNQMVFPLATKVFTPRFYSVDELYRQGVTDPEKIVWFNGFHTCYLKDEQMRPQNPFDKAGIDGPVVLVRPEPEFASFFPDHKPILEKSVEIMAKHERANVVVIPRTEEQRRRYSRMENVDVIESSMYDSPVAHAAVAMGAAETMLMEAFVLGKPSVSAIYWTPSKPVIELHRYIAHSTDPVEIAKYTEALLDDPAKTDFTTRASLLVKSMDNPIRIMIDEIRRINDGQKEKALLGRRSKLEIHLDIIQATSLRPLRPTQIMRNANISYTELKHIIGALESSGLMISENTVGGKFYQTTNEGLRVLEDYRSIRQKLFAEGMSA